MVAPSVAGTLARRRVAVLSGRVHYYEGHDLRTVAFATRILGVLGVRTLVLTNAAGGVNPAFDAGTINRLQAGVARLCRLQQLPQ